MHPPARAFFQFVCPYANCDGTFDLSPAARLVIEQSSLQSAGTLECPGTRSRDGVTRQACGIQLRYVISAEYHALAASQ
jgi:hypothetical protein